MAEMVTVGGIRYRKEDATKEGLTPDSKAHQKRVAEGEAPVGVTEQVFKASQKAAGNDEDRKAAGGRPRGRAANAPLGTGAQDAGTGGDASDVDNEGKSTAGQNPKGDASNAGDK